MNQAIGSFVEKHRTDVAKMQAMSGKTFRSRRDDCVTAFIVSAMVMGIAVLLLVLRSVFGLSFEQFGRDMGQSWGYSVSSSS